MAYSELIAPFVIAGIGMSLFFAPMANIVLSAVRPQEEGQASGANNAIRELGGVFGVAVLASVFASFGGYESGQAFSDGMNPALIVGAIVVGLGAVAAFAIPGRPRKTEAAVARAAARRRLGGLPPEAEAGRRDDERDGDEGEGDESRPQPRRLGQAADDRRPDEEAQVAERRHGGKCATPFLR